MHYRPIPTLDAFDVERFWSTVEQLSDDECWIWLALPKEHGYGRFYMPNQTLKAHRVAYFLTYGVDPLDLLVCHSCDNPPCCNPRHLFLGTEKDNIQDAKHKGRLRAGVGERHGTKTHPESHAYGERSVRAILTDADARLVRDMYIDGLRQREIAARFGITREAVSQIVRGNNWKHIIRPGEPVSLSDPLRLIRYGKDNPASKVTLDQVRAIRQRWGEGGVTLRSLGEQYGITRESVYNIIHRKTWK